MDLHCSFMLICPHMLFVKIVRGTNVLMSNVTVRDSPNWTLHFAWVTRSVHMCLLASLYEIQRRGLLLVNMSICMHTHKQIVHALMHRCMLTHIHIY